jgi:hypothetical protein
MRPEPGIRASDGNSIEAIAATGVTRRALLPG